MRSVVTAALCLVFISAVTSSCGVDGKDILPTPFGLGQSPLPPPATDTANETDMPTPLQLDNFVPPDSVTGLGSVLEALVEGRILQLEVARTPWDRANGLMERASLPENAAMLFVYEKEEYLSFWMKDTWIPLDILFLNDQGVVVDVQTMDVQIWVADGALKRYRSAQPARFALEMNAGLAESLGILPGVQVFFR